MIVPDTTTWNLCGPNTNSATCMCAQYPTGNIRNARFSNITIDNAPKEYSLIYGKDTVAAVDGVNFNNITMAGVLLTPSNYRTQGNFIHEATYATNVTFTADSDSNQPPSVTLSAPVSSATYTAPATITVSATASDPDGSIARLEFAAGPQQAGRSICSSVHLDNIRCSGRCVQRAGGPDGQGI